LNIVSLGHIFRQNLAPLLQSMVRPKLYASTYIFC
jgi:hypothetical protein